MRTVGAAERSGPVLELASRGDALTPYLFAALEQRFPVAGTLHVELSAPQRYGVALATFRPSRPAWVERFYKSRLAFRLRSRNARAQHAAMPVRADLVLQVHALFAMDDVDNVLYVDVTHYQVARGWPAWNPLTGRPLRRWYVEERKQYLRALHIFAFYQGTADSLVEDYGVDPARVSVVGIGVNFPDLPAPRVPAPARSRTAETDDGPVVLFIGNDFVRKGGEVLLDAFALVRTRVPDVRLQLVGTRPDIEPAPGVEVLGRINDREHIAALYRQASVFCVPSFFDPLPHVLLEAMAYSLPTVTTPVCGIPDVVLDGVTGLLVEPGDPNTLAEALIALLESPATAARLGAAGRARVEESFQWSSVVDRMAPALLMKAGAEHTTAERVS